MFMIFMSITGTQEASSFFYDCPENRKTQNGIICQCTRHENAIL